ncbi:MAG: hypothetical protein ACXACH_03800 [Candidatus Hermodarchaeia archaeon]|jgi:hypothetical protein
MATDKILNCMLLHEKTTNRSITYAVIDDDEQIIGRISLMHECLVDHEKQMGEDGRIKWPQDDQMKIDRLILDFP